MYDDAHPTAMLSGLLLGILMAMTLFAGPVAWHNAIGDSCRLTSFEIGHSADIACPVAESNVR
jgi:hypothetical protein